MLRNYLSIAFRNILRNKLFSSVNILGLAFGMGSALVIFLWINDELSVNLFHTRINRIYRLMENQEYSDGRKYTFSSTPAPMAPFIKEKFPEIEKSARCTWPVHDLFQVGDKTFYNDGRYVDQDFLDMFSFRAIAGDLTTALKDKNSIVITKKMAERYFGSEDPMGKTLLVNTKNSFTVTCVLENIPNQSSIQFDYLFSFQYFWDENAKGWLDNWENNNIRTFIMLHEGTDATAFANKIKDEAKAHVEKSIVEFFIHPLNRLYLHGDFENGVESGGRIEYVRIFFIVALFVLVVACINFMNLATAQASKRAKEVGLRKVIGAYPRQLFKQFMGESFLMVLLSAVLAFLLVLVVLPYFNEFTGKQIGLNLLDFKILMIFLVVILFTSFLAGSYPALFISGYKPVQVLKGQLKSGGAANVFRKSLVVVQFALSILLIICTVVVYRQMNFMENRDIGFVRENVFYLWMHGDMDAKWETIRTRLLNEPGIESVSAASQLPIDIGNSTYGVEWEGKLPDERILFTNIDVDFDFIQMMKMEMIEGRPFDRSQISDTANYIVNERAAAKFNFKDGTAGRDLTMWERPGKIVGVVKDFNFGSLHSAVDPLILRLPRRTSNNWGCLLIRAKENQTAEAIKSAEKLFKEYAAGYPFNYSFLNQDWEQFYKAEGQRGNIFNALSSLSIFISCLGLFGLSAFSAERRTKELGIRKVLGATVPGLVRLMGKEFAVLVVLASLIGCPVGWYLMDKWLTGYAYHIEVGWFSLAIAALACLLVSLLTVSYHSLKVSTSNPTQSLRYE